MLPTEVIMSSPAPFEPIGELLERSLNIHHIYGEPVHHGDTTVIPVAQVAYGFGAGGGHGPRVHQEDGASGAPSDKDSSDTRSEAQGAGGGGGVRMTPVGALQIDRAGTHFVSFHPLTPWLSAGAVGLAVGCAACPAQVRSDSVDHVLSVVPRAGAQACATKPPRAATTTAVKRRTPDGCCSHQAIRLRACSIANSPVRAVAIPAITIT